MGPLSGKRIILDKPESVKLGEGPLHIQASNLNTGYVFIGGPDLKLNGDCACFELDKGQAAKVRKNVNVYAIGTSKQIIYITEI